MKTEAHGWRIPIWLLPHTLSLDAPLVALAWQALLAAHTHIPLRLAGQTVLAVTVWLIYVADRLLDTRRPGIVIHSAPHRFYRRHWNVSMTFLIAAAAADLLLIAFAVRPQVVRSGLVPSLAVASYMGVIHAPGNRHWIPKELLVALLFTAGTFVVAWTGARNPATRLWAPAISFFLLCLSNLILIERWQSTERRTAPVAKKNPITAAISHMYPVWVSFLAIVCFCYSGYVWYRAIAISAVAMLVLFITDQRLSLDARRVLSDAALLTPMLFLR